MKHFKHFAVIATALALLTSCNMNPIGAYHYNAVHITTYQFSGDVEITSWTDSEEGIEVNTKEYGYIFLSEGTYILLSGKCPICDKRT